jgi:hypothetical protein
MMERFVLFRTYSLCNGVNRVETRHALSLQMEVIIHISNNKVSLIKRLTA